MVSKMKLLTRRNVKCPFSKKQTDAAFVYMRTPRERRYTQKLKGSIPPKQEVNMFNYSLTEMKVAISSKSEVAPSINSVDDLDNWLNS